MSLKSAIVCLAFFVAAGAFTQGMLFAQEHKTDQSPSAPPQAEVAQASEVKEAASHGVAESSHAAGTSGSAVQVHGDAGHDEAGHGEAAHSSDAGHGNGEHGEASVLPPDLTHSNMSPQAAELVDFRTDKAMFTLVVFLLLLAILYATAWKPIMQGLEKREHGIAENISRAERAAAEATAKLAGYEAKLAGAAEEAQRIVANARKDAETAGQRILASAQEEAVRQRDRAVAEIESAKRTALNELAGKSTEIAMSLAQRIVGRELKAEDHQKLVQEMLSKLPSKN